MPFAAQTSRQEAVAVCALSGQLDSRAAGDLERQLTAELGKGPDCLLVDCSELEFITSAGLRVLLMLGKRLGAEGGCLALCSLNAATRQVFDVAGFSTIFPIRPNRQEALAWLIAEGKVSRAAHMARSLLRRAAAPPRERRSAALDVERSDLAAALLQPRLPTPAARNARTPAAPGKNPAQPAAASPTNPRAGDGAANGAKAGDEAGGGPAGSSPPRPAKG
jgi:stage II sporulation protein AA (anti-sigma F factor antagonist)